MSADRFFAKIEPDCVSGCWHWSAGVDSKGYGYFGWRGKTRKAHRVSWELRHGSDPGEMLMLHKCDVPGCVNPDHLFPGTYTDNARDMAAKGRNYLPTWFGSGNPAAKLTDDDVKAIKVYAASGLSQRKIARKFSVSQRTVHDVLSGRYWRHVK